MERTKRALLVALAAGGIAISGSAKGQFAANGFVFPSVASAPGQFGAYFRTRVVLANVYTTPRTVLAVLATPSGPISRTLVLNANEFRTWTDFVADVFGYTGGGGLGLLELDGRLFSAHVEVYTESGAARYGTTVQPLVDKDRVTSSIWGNQRASYALGFRRDTNNRVNYGCANFNQTTTTVDISYRVSNGPVFTDLFTMPSGTWQQRSLTNGDGNGAMDFRVRGSEPQDSRGVYCYTVTVNNATNDGSVIASATFQ